jgi:GTP-binding protein HflX
LILHVVDASSPEAKLQYDTTCDVLKDLKCDEKEKIVVLNKADLLTTPAAVNAARTVVPGALRLSALDRPAVIRLREQILNHFRTRMETWDLLVPYSEGKFQSQLQEYGSILQERYLEKGIFYQVKLDSTLALKLGVKRYAMA